MKIAEVKESIFNLLETIVKRSQIIEKQYGSRNLIEIDLAMDDTRLLYRELEHLRKLTEADSEQAITNVREKITQPARGIKMAETPVPVPAPVQEVITEPEVEIHQEAGTTTVFPPKPAVPEVNAIPVSQSRPVEAIPVQKTVIKGVETKPSPPKQQVKPQPEPVAQKPLASVVAPVNESSAAIKEKPVTLVGEKFVDEKGSIYERLASIRDDKSIGTKMQYKPVASIKEAIGINEKFLFINELFGGDINAYNNAVSILNSCNSILEAFDLLNQYTTQFNWDGQRSGETIDRFANLVQRRYM